MRLRESIEVALLLAVGYVLHLIVPPIVLGMKPDLLLGMLFVIILMKRDAKLSIQAGIVAGIIAALTTGFPGGQVPNVIDKLLTTLLVYGMVRAFGPHLNPKILSGIIGAIGTVFSGTVFLGSAALLVGLPGPFTVLFTTVVIPATIVNTLAVIVLFPVVEFSKKTVGAKLPQESV